MWTAAGERKSRLRLPVPGRLNALAVIPTVIRLPELANNKNLPANVNLFLPAHLVTVGFRFDGTIATVHPDGKVLFWNFDGNLKREIFLKPRQFRVTAVAPGPEGIVVTGYEDGTVIKWSSVGKRERFFSLPSVEPVMALAVSGDGSIRAKGHGNKSFILVGSITAAMWIWISFAFAILGIGFFLAPIWQGDDLEHEEQVLESDSPVGDPNNATEAMKHLSKVMVSLVANPRTYGPLTVCIDGAWGSGKTSLISLVYRELRNYKCTCIYFDAWHHQNENHLFAALTEQIRKSWRPRAKPSWPGTVVETLPFVEGIAARSLLLKDTVFFFLTIWGKRFWRSRIFSLAFISILLFSGVIFIVLLLTGFQELFGHVLLSSKLFSPKPNGHNRWLLFLAYLTGSLSVMLYLWFGPWNFLKPFAASPVSLIRTSVGWFKFGQSIEQLSFRYRFQNAFREVCDVLNILERRLVIFIDDLDRCEREHMLEILEATNYLTSSGSCFIIFAMDKKRVKDELKQHNPNSEQSSLQLVCPEKFLEKIINLNIEVPKPNFSEVRKVREK